MNNWNGIIDHNLSSIFSSIKEYLSKTKKSDEIGLYEGSSSKIVLCYYSFLATKDDFFLSKALSILKNSFNLINNLKIGDFSFGYGLTGFAWTILHLQNENLIDHNVIDTKGLDHIIKSNFNKKNLNLDFAAGDLGHINYFLDKGDSRNELDKIVDILYDRVKYKSILLLPNQMVDEKGITKPVQYYGMSHGIAGLLVLISKILIKGFAIEKCKVIIESIIHHLQRDSDFNQFEIFPLYKSKKTTHREYLFSWCHGDFCIGYALILSGHLLERKEIIEFGIKIINVTLKKESEYIDIVEYPIFCHGKIGISHMYRRLYMLTENNLYKEASARWYNRINKNISSKEDIFGKEGLLLGYEGFALSELSLISKIEPKWDKILLLS